MSSPKLPPAPEGWDGEGAARRAVEEHVLDPERHDTPEEAHAAALGSVILSYLDSLPPKEYLVAILTLKGPKGYPEGSLLAQAEDGAEREALLSAARLLASEGKLRRGRDPKGGEIFWKPSGPLLAKDETGAEAGSPSPLRTTDGEPTEGGSAV